MPTYLPFAYDSSTGNVHIDLTGVLPELNEENNTPAMYFSTNQNDINAQHEFLIKVKTSSRNTTMDLNAFMIVEGSETVKLNGNILNKDIDYTIDYYESILVLPK